MKGLSEEQLDRVLAVNLTGVETAEVLGQMREIKLTHSGVEGCRNKVDPSWAVRSGGVRCWGAQKRTRLVYKAV